QQVVGNSGGVFPDHATFVGTDGIEVTQQGNVPLAVWRVGDIAQDFFHHQFTAPIRIGGRGGKTFIDRDAHWVTIHSGRGTEDQLPYRKLLHDLHERQGAGHVVAVIFHGNLAGFAHG